jgi:hypothetical protein
MFLHYFESHLGFLLHVFNFMILLSLFNPKLTAAFNIISQSVLSCLSLNM